MSRRRQRRNYTTTPLHARNGILDNHRLAQQRGRTQGVYKGICARLPPPGKKMSDLDLTSDAEYVANLVNANI